MTNAIDPIQKQIEDAKAASANLASNAGVPAVQTGQSVTTYAPAAHVPAMSMSMEDSVSNHFAPTKWLKVNENGLKIDNSPLFDDLVVVINPSECVLAQVVKYGNSPARYIKTYDGVNTVHGDNFAVKVQEAYRIDPKCKGVYKSVDIPMRPFEPVLSPKKGDDTVYATEDDILGHSLSTTNFSEWAQFYKKLMALGLTQTPVKVKLGMKQRTGNGNTWGILTFELIESLEAAEAA